MEKRRVKKTTKKSLGMKPIAEKPLTKRQIAIQDAKMIKQLEMAKPVNQGCDDIYYYIKELEKELEKEKESLLFLAKQAIENNERFESFIYIKESWIPDNDKILAQCLKYDITMSTKVITDWKSTIEDLKAFEIEVPKKRKVAYLRSVKK